VVFAWVMMMPLTAIVTICMLFVPLFWPYLLWINFNEKPERGGRRWQPARDFFIWGYFRDYFPVDIKHEAELDPSKNYFFCAHPHGILPLSLFSNFATEATRTAHLFPNHLFHLCTLDSNFHTPILREIFMALGMIPVSEGSIRYVLSHRQSRSKGNVVIDVPGGSSESLDQKPGTARLTIRRRRGIFRIALEEGVEIVPVFSFGDAGLWKQKANPKGSWLRWAQETGKSLIGMSPTLFYGDSLSGEGWGFLPARKTLTTIVGKPLQVTRVDKATDEDIGELRERYIQELIGLYDRWKDTYAPDRIEDLKIVG